MGARRTQGRRGRARHEAYDPSVAYAEARNFPTTLEIPWAGCFGDWACQIAPAVVPLSSCICAPTFRADIDDSARCA